MNNTKTVGGDLASAVLLFNWVEYSVFSTMLILSLLIGVYYGWFKKQDTVAEYMLGGKKMNVFPVTLSLIFSHLSGIAFLGVPAEIYMFGSQYFANTITILIVLVLVNYFFLPVFFELQLNSLYEYFELRFDKTMRTMASIIFAVSLVFYIPVVIYIPAIAFNQVTGVSVHIITPIVSFICVFYTLFGGLKAVVWTDALQSFFTVGSTVFIIILGFIKIGSISKVLRINEEGSRLEFFNMDPDPREQMTFWTVVFGSIYVWGSHVAIHPGAVQRFIAVSTLREAKLVMVGFAVGFIFIMFLIGSVGLILYANYHNCDPIATKMVQKSGQILPFFVMDVARNYQGLTGLFISGVLSAALSTMSAGLNTVAGTLYEDFVQYVLKGKKQTDKQHNIVLKLITLVVGIISILMVFAVERLGTVVQMAYILLGLTNGTLCGVFTLGLFFPRANHKGAKWGTVCSLLGTSVLIMGAQYYKTLGLMIIQGKVTSVDGCPQDFLNSLPFNASALVQTYRGVGFPTVTDDSVPQVFRLSYMYYSAVGNLLVLLVGLPVSYFTEPPEPRCLNPKLFTPFIRKYLPEKCSTENIVNGDYILVSTKIKDSEKGSEIAGA